MWPGLFKVIGNLEASKKILEKVLLSSPCVSSVSIGISVHGIFLPVADCYYGRYSFLSLQRHLNNDY